MFQNTKLFGIAVWLLTLSLGAMRTEVAECQMVPFLDGGQMILVPVKLFDRTLYFIVDTGCAISAIDAKYESYLGDQVGAGAAVGTLGIKNDVPIYRCPDLSIGGQSVALTKVAGFDLKMFNMISGEPCDGVLGMDWFAKNVVFVNFDDQTISIGGAVPKLAGKNFVAVALEQTNGYYAAKIPVNQNKLLSLMIDTGDSSSISLNQEAWQEVFSANNAKIMTAMFADAAAKTAQTKVGVLDQVTIQGLNYTNLHALMIQNPGQRSRLGLAFFRRHNVVFDFGGRMLYLQPGKNYLAPDTEDMSGLHLLRVGDKTVVYSVDDPSPASAQGVAANDIIEAVNDQPASSLKMKSIREILRSADTDVVVLKLRRGGSMRDVRIVLKKSI